MNDPKVVQQVDGQILIPNPAPLTQNSLVNMTLDLKIKFITLPLYFFKQLKVETNNQSLTNWKHNLQWTANIYCIQSSKLKWLEIYSQNYLLQG